MVKNIIINKSKISLYDLTRSTGDIDISRLNISINDSMQINIKNFEIDIENVNNKMKGNNIQ